MCITIVLQYSWRLKMKSEVVHARVQSDVKVDSEKIL